MQPRAPPPAGGGGEQRRLAPIAQQDSSKKLAIGIGNPLRARTAAAAVAAGAAAAAAAAAADDGDKGCPSPIDVAKLPRLGTAGSSRMMNVLAPGARVGSRALVATQVEIDPNVVPWKTGNMYPIVENKLSFASHVSDDFTLREIKRRPDLFFFSSDLQERYEPYCADFGPVNLSVTVRFCDLLRGKMGDPRLASRHLVYYCDDDPAIRANTAYLLGAFLVLELKYSIDEACAPFECLRPNPFPPFRDATYCPVDYPITLRDCFEALLKAVKVGWFDLSTFDLEDYEEWDHPQNGDMHLVCPKYIAFKGPSDKREKISPGLYTLTPANYIDVFTRKGVTAVVRLNEPDTYNAAPFVEAGINHHELYFDDCTVPSDAIVKRFLDLSDKEKGVVSVHCKAGLGRTGTLIGLWMMKNHGFTANNIIAWLRIVRPGCVIGPQQQYLKDCEGRVWLGNSFASPLVPRKMWPGAASRGGGGASSEAIAKQVAEAMEARAAVRVGGGPSPMRRPS